MHVKISVKYFNVELDAILILAALMNFDIANFKSIFMSLSSLCSQNRLPAFKGHLANFIETLWNILINRWFLI